MLRGLPDGAAEVHYSTGDDVEVVAGVKRGGENFGHADHEV